MFKLKFSNFALSNKPQAADRTCAIQQDFPHLIIPDLIYRLKVDRIRADEKFIVFFLLSKQGRLQIEAQARGSSGSMVKLAQGHLKDFQIPTPPLQEQVEIVKYLDAVTNRIDRMIDNAQSAITRLTEYRTALITAATTGKIDVRQIEVPAQAYTEVSNLDDVEPSRSLPFKGRVGVGMG